MRRTSNQAPAPLEYNRVSTLEQGSSMGLEAQRDAVCRYTVQHRLVIAAEIEEIVSTRKERPELDRALQLCEELG